MTADEGRVARVVDGDTALVVVDGDERRVRLLGVDAPESVTPDRPVECFGPSPRAAAAACGARAGEPGDATGGPEGPPA